MPTNLGRQVRRRARQRREYCCMPQAYDDLPFEVDHIVARKNGGRTTLGNLAWSGLGCHCHNTTAPYDHERRRGSRSL